MKGKKTIRGKMIAIMLMLSMIFTIAFSYGAETNGSEATRPHKFTKTWVGDNESGRPESIKIQVYQNDKEFQVITLKPPAKHGKWESGEIGFPMRDKYDNNYKYTYKEINVSGYHSKQTVTENGKRGLINVDFTNCYNNLTVEKKVTGSAAPLGQSYTFTLMKGSKAVKNLSYSINGGDMETSSNGSFQLKGDQKASFFGLPADSGYYVVEGEPGSIDDVSRTTTNNVGSMPQGGSLTPGKNKDGLKTDTFCIANGVTKAVVFTNNYTGDYTGIGNLAIKDTLSGSYDVPEDTTFTFDIYKGDKKVTGFDYTVDTVSETKVKAANSIILEAGQTATIKGLEVGDYTILETEKSFADATRTTSYDIGTDDDNDLKSKAITIKNGKTNNVVCDNKYEAEATESESGTTPLNPTTGPTGGTDGSKQYNPSDTSGPDANRSDANPTAKKLAGASVQTGDDSNVELYAALLLAALIAAAAVGIPSIRKRHM